MSNSQHLSSEDEIIASPVLHVANQEPQAPAEAEHQGQPRNLAEVVGEVMRIMRRDQHVDEMRGWLLVVAALFATITFQAGMNPPGGFWPDDLDPGIPTLAIDISPPLTNQTSFNVTMTRAAGAGNIRWHGAGDSVLAAKHTTRYLFFYAFNTMALFYSVFVIFRILCENFKPRTPLFTLKALAIFNVPLILMSYVLATLSFATKRHSVVSGVVVVVFAVESIAIYMYLEWKTRIIRDTPSNIRHFISLAWKSIISWKRGNSASTPPPDISSVGVNHQRDA